MDIQVSNNVLVTVGIPFFNDDAYLEQAILSVLNQSYKTLILLLIDDGSTDNSLKIASSFKYDKRVKVYSDSENRGLSFRLNQISNFTKTKYLARMDADDVMHPERVKRQLAALEANPKIDVLGTNVYSINKYNVIDGIRYAAAPSEELRKVGSFIHPTIMAKSEWFKSNPYDVLAVRSQDSELWFRTRKYYNFQILLEPLLFYRELGDNYYKKYIKSYKSLLYVMRKHNYAYQTVKSSFRCLLFGFIYFGFNLLGKENVLLKRRSQVKLIPFSIEKYINR